MPLVSVHVDNWEFIEPAFSVRNDMPVITLQVGTITCLYTNVEIWVNWLQRGLCFKITNSGDNTVPWYFRARPALASTGQESVETGVQIYLCWEKNTHMDLEQKINKFGSIKSISAFCSESSAAYPTTFQNQTRCWGRCMQSGFLCRRCMQKGFKTFHLTVSICCVSLSAMNEVMRN